MIGKESVREYVTITLPRSKWHEGRNHFHGPVISRANYKTPDGRDCWYIEFIDEQWGYCYIKQDQDGGGIFMDATVEFSGPMGTPLEA